MSFWAYMLRCSDGKYYTSHTDDLEGRIAAHQAGQVPGYTQKRRPVRLVWSETFFTREEALSVERQLKGWSRAKKEALICGDWARVRALASRAVLRDGPSPALSPSSGGTDGERARSDSVRPEEPLSEGEAASRRTPVGKDPRPPAIILVRPQLGENIGKAARAMLNFGLADLRLVAPRDGWPNPSAGPAASGADIVLEQARVFETVADAVTDCAHIYATTVRKRGLVMPVVTPEEAALEIASQAEPSAILFGAERSGLETDEVAIAGKILTVPVNPDFRSLNLAQAVILVAYEWSKRQALAVPTEGEEAEPRAPQEHLEGLIVQLEASLEKAGYYHPPDRTPATKNTIRTILTKPGWSTREVQALRGVIRALAEERQRGKKKG